MKPMLAAKAELDKLKFPLYASPKLDGIRAMVIDGVVVSRKLIAIPNKHVQERFGRPEFNGLDGELIVGDPFAPCVFRDTTSIVMSRDKPATDVVFWVFDHFQMGGRFQDRYEYLESHRRFGPDMALVPHYRVGDKEELESLDADHVQLGYEGTMLRSPDGPYKHGRSTVNEGYLLKLKQFEDDEAEIIGFEELMHNGNVAEKDNLGRTKRSSHQANKTGLDRLGALVLRRPDGVEFNCGTGFDDFDRQAMWGMREKLLGKQAKYRFFPSGGKDKPRFPVFLGLRDAIDVGDPA